ncbi:MAG TPA: class I SAM-dependent methyltransferase [Rhizomicrobium sp.]|jgi:SAM-dependent methyltransferase|nr:class I SAM-dependent methyltransferase [Rhizomicrobium sp.]
MDQPDYDPRRFRANVPFYARYRLGYPDSLIHRISRSVGLERGDAVLDLGAGPGLLAIPFARAGMAVTAVDPEPGMLAELKESAAGHGVAVNIRRGSSFDMPAGLGPFRLVTIGRAFHWMNRPAALEMLDGMIGAGGAIALVHDDHPPTVENIWRGVLRDVADRYGRADAPHVRETHAKGYRSHESVLLDSPFSQLERVGVIIRRELTADDIVGLAHSLSALSPEKLGTRAQAFETELREELARLSPDNRFIEIAELFALIAKRG